MTDSANQGFQVCTYGKIKTLFLPFRNNWGSTIYYACVQNLAAFTRRRPLSCKTWISNEFYFPCFSYRGRGLLRSLYQEEELKLCIIDQKPVLRYEHICHNTAKYLDVVVYFESKVHFWMDILYVCIAKYETDTFFSLKLYTSFSISKPLWSLNSAVTLMVLLHQWRHIIRWNFAINLLFSPMSTFCSKYYLTLPPPIMQ